MSSTISLKTTRLLLRKYEISDADRLYQILGCDEDMYRYSGWNPYATMAMARKTVEEYRKHDEDEHFYGWAIDLTGELIGSIGAYDYCPETGTIEVGFSIAKDYWNQGYGSEALVCILRYLTESERMSCVKAWCAADNVGSRKVLEKAGMKFIKTITKGLKINGQVLISTVLPI